MRRRVSADGLVPARAGSELAVETLTLGAGVTLESGSDEADTIVLVASGGCDHPAGSALLFSAGERVRMTAGAGGMVVLRASIGPGCDRHAVLGQRESLVAVDEVEGERATGKRSFQVLFGPHNGSTRATLFVGYIPPGAAPWHFHLYDEIVWIWRGEGRFHTRGGVEPLSPGSAFRIAPREVHVVENTSATDELVVVGLFSPAGSPSAAYLAGEAPEYLLEAAS